MEAIEDERVETERLRLRTPEMSDEARVAEFIGDWDVAKMLANVPHPYARKDARIWLAPQKERRASGEAYNCAIELKASPGLIGVIGLTGIRMIEGGNVADFGYWLAKPYWNKGIMTEAGRALVRHAFKALGFAGLKSGHFKENFRSGNVLAKLGFRYAGEGPKYCLARKAEVPHIDVVMTRAQWRDQAAGRGHV